MRRSFQILEIEDQLIARQGIQRAERLVHQQLRWIVDQGATEGDTLAHTARELMRILVLEAVETNRSQQLARAPLGG